jgi:hypothetical protein
VPPAFTRDPNRGSNPSSLIAQGVRDAIIRIALMMASPKATPRTFSRRERFLSGIEILGDEHMKMP